MTTVLDGGFLRNNKGKKQNEISEIGLVAIEEATHLFRNDDYSLYMKISCEGKHICLLFNKSGFSNQFISEREKEVLSLISQGYSSKEVSKKLLITPETVNKHRKNMIAKTNAKDTSSLIQICKICEIL